MQNNFLSQLFGKKIKHAGIDELSMFINQHAAFLVQKCLYEYSRARTGTMSIQLFNEKEFQDAIEFSRWTCYPMGLICVTKMVDAALFMVDPSHRSLWISHLKTISEQFLSDYHQAGYVSHEYWQENIKKIHLSLDQASLAKPLSVQDIPKEIHDDFYNHLPIHKSLTTYDHEMIGNNLRINLTVIHDKFNATFEKTQLIKSINNLSNL